MSDQDSDLLDKIRTYMMSHGGFGGADNRSYDVAMNVDPSSSTAKGYSYGGEVCMADGGVVPDMGTVPMPTEATPAPTQNILGNAQNLGRQLYGQYTPENRNALYTAMLQRQNSMPNAIGSSLASVGDAIARGYGHDQTNFLDKTQQNQKDALKEGLDAFDTAQKGTLGMTQAGMELGRITPNSDLSKLSQDAYSGPLKKLGYTDAEISKMPASQIESVAQVALKYGDIQSQKELKEATLQLQSMVANANVANNMLMRKQEQERIANESKKVQHEQDVEAAKHWIMHPQAAAAANARLAGLEPSASTGTIQPPHGQTVTQNGHTYTWNPNTGKYE
jgi:hypothetical protein